MRAAAIGLLVAACGPAAAPPVAQNVAVEQPKPVKPPTSFVDRSLSVGSRMPTAFRGSWELFLEGNTARLVQTEQEAPGTFTVERADREARWTTTRTHVEKGPLRHDGDHLALDLESPGDSLFLRCWHRSIVVAMPGARRVPTPGRAGDCTDPGTWSPTTTTRIDALVCGQGDALDDGQVGGLDGQGGSLDETLFRFAPAPGIEVVEVTDDCFQSMGLRLAK